MNHYNYSGFDTSYSLCTNEPYSFYALYSLLSCSDTLFSACRHQLVWYGSYDVFHLDGILGTARECYSIHVAAINARQVSEYEQPIDGV